MGNIVAKIRNMSFGYDKDQLLFDNFSIDINEGEVVTIVGKSGSGKSTLFELIAKTLKPLRGTIETSSIGWVFQDPYSSFHPSYTIIHQIKEVAHTHNIEKLANQMQLSLALLSKMPHELSGGQLQRCSILRAILMEPKLILCDEPTSALDNIVQLEVMKLLLKQLNNKALLLITHDLDLAYWVSDRIYSLETQGFLPCGNA
ncbi:MAG TPA: ATP-binding cassette domain-containing protein [Epsilonproteobacteria bacterium]|nr:ATP-binding cassette domain-containing protein [Campylobacterota bacterium]